MIDAIFSVSREEGLSYLALSGGSRTAEERRDAGCRTTAGNFSTGTTGEPCGGIKDGHNRKTRKQRQQSYKLAPSPRFSISYIEDRS